MFSGDADAAGEGTKFWESACFDEYWQSVGKLDSPSQHFLLYIYTVV